MRRQIMRAQIRFDFHNPANPFDSIRPLNQMLAQQFSGNLHGISIVE